MRRPWCGARVARRDVPRRRRILAIGWLAMMTLVAPVASAQEGGASRAVPSGDQVLDRFVEVTGGRAAHDSIRTRVVWTTLTLPAQEITLAVTLYQARPNRQRTLVESPLVGRIESGVCDGVAWELSTTGGPRLKQGAEKEDALRDALFDGMARWRDAYVAAEVTGVDTVGGKPCHRVVLTPGAGRPRTAYFDIASGLIARLDVTVETPAGTATFQSLPGDYRREGAILMSHRNEVTAMGQRRVAVVDSVALNRQLPAERFDMPAEVRKLLPSK